MYVDSLVGELRGALNDSVDAISAMLQRKDFSDVIVLLEDIEQRLSSHTAHFKQTHVSTSWLWDVLCFRASTPTDKQQATLLSILPRLRENVCVSSNREDSKALKKCLSTLLFALQYPFRRCVATVQLARARDVVWDVFMSLHHLHKHTDSQAECLSVLRSIIAPETFLAAAQGGAEPDSQDAAISGVQFGVDEMAGVCVSVCERKAAGGGRLKSMAMQLLGCMSARYPVDMSAKASRVFECFKCVASRLTEQTDVEQMVGEGFFLGIKDYLKVFPLSYTVASERAFVVTLHQMVKNAMLLAESTSNYRFCKSALVFLRHHATTTLAECIASDAEDYFSILQRLWEHKNVDVHRAAYPATASFLQALSQQLSELSPAASIFPAPAADTSLVLGRLLDKLEATLRFQDSTRSQLAFALVACGYLARPLRYRCGDVALLAVFDGLAEKCDVVFSAAAAATATAATPAYVAGADGSVDAQPLVGGDDIVRLIPQFLTAFACFFLEIPYISQSGLKSAQTVVGTALTLLPHPAFFERIRDVTAPALLKLLVSVQYHGAVTQMSLYSWVCERTLQLVAGEKSACESEDDSGSTDEGENGEPDLFTEEPNEAQYLQQLAGNAHTVYARLWLRLLSSQACEDRSWGYPWQSVDVARPQAQLRVTFQRLLLQTVRGLDLAVTATSGGETLPLHVVLMLGQGAIQPRCQADYQAFLRLVALHTAIARSLWCQMDNASAAAEIALGDRLGEWLVHVLRIAKLYPHVSGFLVLSYTALQVARGSASLSDGVQRTLMDAAAVCEQRLQICTDELLYQCCMFLLVVSRWIPASPQALVKPLTIVLACHSGIMADVETVNAESALAILFDCVEHQPHAAAVLVPSLLASASVMEQPRVRDRLCLLAAKYGIEISAALLRGSVAVHAKSVVGPAYAPQRPRWKVREVLLKLPFGGTEIHFPVVRLLPKVVHLSQYATERTTRTTSAELLHFAVTWMLGNGAGCEDVFPAMVQLAAQGTDDGAVAAEIFHALLLQCARWFGGAGKVKEAETLERVLLEQLGSSSGAVRRVASEALVEYVRWSSKRHPSGSSRTGVSQGVRVLLLSESIRARLGAATFLHQLLAAVRAESAAMLVGDAHSLVSALASAARLSLCQSNSEEFGVMRELSTCMRLLCEFYQSTSSGSRSREALQKLSVKSAEDVEAALLCACKETACIANETAIAAARLLGVISSVRTDVGQHWRWSHNHGPLLNQLMATGTAAEEVQGGLALCSVLIEAAVLPPPPGTAGAGSSKRSHPDSIEGPTVHDAVRLLLCNASAAIAKYAIALSLQDANGAVGMPEFFYSLQRFLRSVIQQQRDRSSSDKSTYMKREVASHLVSSSLFKCTAAMLLASETTGSIGPSSERRDCAIALLESVSVLLPWHAEADSMRSQLVDALREKLPLFCRQSTKEGCMDMFLASPISVSDSVADVAALTRLPFVNADGRTDPINVWTAVVGLPPFSSVSRAMAALTQFLHDAVRDSRVALTHRGALVCRSVALLLVGGGGVGFGDLLTAVLGKDEEREDSVAPGRVRFAAATREVEEEEEEEKEATQGDCKDRVGFRVATDVVLDMCSTILTEACESERYVALAQYVRDIASAVTASIVYQDKRKRADSMSADLGNPSGGWDYEQNVPVLLLRHALRLQVRCFSVEHMRHALVEATTAVVLAPVHVDMAVVSLQLQMMEACWRIDSAGAWSCGALRTAAVDVVKRACTSEAWTGRRHALLSSRDATRLLVLSSRVYRALLGGDARTEDFPEIAKLVACGVHTMECIVREELPLDWREVGSETLQSSNYHAVVQGLTVMCGALTPRSTAALRTMLPLLAQTDLPHSAAIAATVDTALHSLRSAELLALCQECMQLQKEALPRQMWWAATYRISLPALRSFPVDIRVSFFVEHVSYWVRESEETPIISCHKQSNALTLLETMYRLTDATDLKGRINDAYTGREGSANTGKELTLALIKLCSAARVFAYPGGANSTAEMSELRAEARMDLLSYRQAAYRCLVAVLTATQDKEAVFVKLLLDSSNVDMWNKIINTTCAHELSIETNFLRVAEVVAKESSDWELKDLRPTSSKRGARLTGAPGAAEGITLDSWWLSMQPIDYHSSVGPTNGESANSFMNHALHSQRLSAQRRQNPLLSHYGWSQRTMPLPSSSFTSMIDMDEVWRSTCSGVLFSLIDFMIDRFGCSHPMSSAHGVAATSLWVREVEQLLASDKIHTNARLVVLRMVQLRRGFFAQHASILRDAVIAVATHPSVSSGGLLHYVARDVVVMVMGWVRDGYTSWSEGTGAYNLVRFLVHAVPRTDSAYVGRCNIELFKALWEQVATVPCLRPSDLALVLRSDASAVPVCVQMCGVIADSGTCLATLAAPTTVAPSEVRELYQELLKYIEGQKGDGALAAAEVVGMELRALQAHQASPQESGSGSSSRVIASAVMEDLYVLLREGTVRVLMKLWRSGNSSTAALKALRVVETYNSSVLSDFLPSTVFANFASSGSDTQLLVMDVLGCAPKQCARVYDILHAQFAGSLTRYNVAVRNALYALLALLVPHLSVDALRKTSSLFLTEEALRHMSGTEDSRVAFYKLCVAVLSNTSGHKLGEEKAEGSGQRAFTQPVYDILISSGLQDSSLFVQDVVLEYMDKYGCSEHAAERLAQLLDALKVSKCDAWLRHAAVLLLSLSRRSRSFDDCSFLFSKPLVECNFTRMVLGSKSQASVSRQAPLFSQSVAEALRGVGGVTAAAVNSITYVGASQHSSAVGAHSLQTSTQSSVGGSSAAASWRRGRPLPSSLQMDSAGQFTALAMGRSSPRSQVRSGLIFTRSGESVSGARDFTLRRLQALPESAKVLKYMQAAARNLTDRVEEERKKASLQASQVIVFRDYREGEVPDIQVSLQGFVTPLQALCLRDSEVASLVCATLAEDILAAMSAPATAQGVPHAPSPVPYFARDAGNRSLPPDADSARLSACLRDLVERTVVDAPSSAASTFFTREAAFLYRKAGGSITTAQCQALVAGTRGGEKEESNDVSHEGAVVQLVDDVMATICRKDERADGKSSEEEEEGAEREQRRVGWLAYSNALQSAGDADMSAIAIGKFLSKEDAGVFTEALRMSEDGAFALEAERLQSWLESHGNSAPGVRDVLSHQLRVAKHALLQWESMADTFPSAATSMTEWCIATRSEARLVIPILVRGSTHQDKASIPGTLQAVMEKAWPAEWSQVLLGQGRWTECEQYVSSVLPRVLASSDGNGIKYREAFRLMLSLDAACVLSSVERDQPRAMESLRQYIATVPLAATEGVHIDAHVVDEALWVRACVDAALGDRYSEKFFPNDLEALRSASRSAQQCICQRAGESLLSTREWNGAVRTLLAHAHKLGSSEAHLWPLAARARAFDIAYSAKYYRAPSSSPQEQLEKLVLRYSTRRDSLTETDRRKLGADLALCAITLGLNHRGSVNRPSDLYAEAKKLAECTEEGFIENDLVLLDAIDHILSHITQGAWHQHKGTGSHDSDAVAGCWRMFASTMVRCLHAHGGTSAVESRTAAPITRVPRLLQLFDVLGKVAGGEDAEWAATLESLAALPVTVWLPWTSQLISAVLRTGHPLLAEVLAGLAEAHPQSVYFPYHCATEELRNLEVACASPAAARTAGAAKVSSVTDRDAPIRLGAALNRLRQTLLFSSELAAVRAFASELHKLHDPEQRLITWMRAISGELQQYSTSNANDREHYDRAQELFLKACADCLDPSQWQETEVVNRRYAALGASENVKELFCKDGVLTKDPTAFSKAFTEALNRLKKGGAEEAHKALYAADTMLLENYSARLSQCFEVAVAKGEQQILLPIQPVMLLHTSSAEPLKECVFEAASSMKVMRSKERPKRLTLFTSRGPHMFLAKGGDDLRLDQRIQEIFVVLNGFLLSSSSSYVVRDSSTRCWRRHIIRTYSVIPVSRFMGLVEWVPETEVLSSIISNARSDFDTIFSTASAAFRVGFPSVEDHLKSYVNKPNTRGQFSSWFDNIVRKIPSDMLEHGLMELAPSHCGWYAVRNAFLQSNAAVSIASYVLGVGDRHLSNFLVDKFTGELIAIDFGYAFGEAVRKLPIPELVPFRLSPQMHYVQGALGSAVTERPMQHVLHVLRSSRSIIEGLVASFAYEPLVQWKYESIYAGQSSDEAATSRIVSVSRKLNLECPGTLLLEDLKANRFVAKGKRSLLEAIQTVVEADGRRRAEHNPAETEMANDNNLAEQAFVNYLVDLATDSNVLGRAYSGWQPFF